MSTFVSGRELSMRFYQEHVRPVLHIGYPDHNWEPRVLLFLREADYARHGEAVERSLRVALPARFAG